MGTSVMYFRDLGSTKPEARILRNESTVVAARINQHEQWLWRNDIAMRTVQTGLAELAAGKVVSLGSFAQYADLDIDD